MNTRTHVKDQLALKQLELNSILEITQAINSNLPEPSLYKIYRFTLMANLNIEKLALFVLDDEWICKVNFGTKRDYSKVQLNDHILSINEITSLKHVEGGVGEGGIAQPHFHRRHYQEFEEFEIIIPVLHKTNVLAYTFLGGFSGKQPRVLGVNLSFIETFTNIIIQAIENKKFARKQRRQEAEIQVAREVQEMLFPEKLPYNKELKVFASYIPHQEVGGDYYDFIPINSDQFLLCIADVSGKGIPAALLMSNFQASLRTLIRLKNDLKEIITELNYITFHNSKGERFITCFMAIFDKKTRRLTYINAGHSHPLLLSENNNIIYLKEGTTVLGAFDKLPFINKKNLILDSGMLLFTYTDGLTELNNEKDQEFGIAGIESFIKKTDKSDLRMLHKKLIKHLDTFRGSRDYKDDVTILTCKFEQPP